MIYREFLPEVSGRFPEGAAMLARLQHQAQELTRIAKSLRGGHPSRLDYEAVCHQARFMDLDIFTDLNPTLFRFTGYAVVVRPESFFEAYEKTEEGQLYCAMMKKEAPELYGQFTYRHFPK